MQRFAVRLSVMFAGAMLAAGCEANHYSRDMLAAPGERAEETDTAHVTVDTANYAQLRGVPIQVKRAFAQDYPEAAVTSVELVPTGNGGMFYQIGYIENGTPGRAVFHSNGSTALADSGRVVIPEPSLVPITPPPPGPAEPETPTTVPSTAPGGVSARDLQ